MSATDIIAFAFNAELLCPRCTFESVGHASTGPVRGNSPVLHAAIANYGVIDKGLDTDPPDPRWFDSTVIPQPVFAHEEREPNETCGRCGDVIE